MLHAEDLTPGDLFRVFWRQRAVLAGFALAGAAIAYGYSLFIPDRYTAETLVLVEDAKLSRDYVQSTSTLDLRARLGTMREQVLSRTRVEQLVHEYEFADADDDMEQAVARVRRRIALDVMGQDGFRLSFTDEDPRMAARVANALAGFFIAESTDAMTQQVRTTAAGIQEQAEEIDRQLDAKEQEIAAFKSANLLLLPDRLESNLRMVQTLRQSLRDNATRSSAVRGQLAALPRAEPTTAATVRAESARDAARRILAAAGGADLSGALASEHPLVQLEARRLQREALLRRFTDRHPDVRLVSAQIAALERRVAEAPPYQAASLTAPAPSAPADGTRAALELELGRLESERGSLQSDLDTYQQRVAGAPAVEQQLNDLERERSTLARSHDDLASRNVEASLASDLQNANAPFSRYRVIDPAVVPTNPSSPLRLLFLLGGAFAGVGVVVGAVLLREMVFEPVSATSEIERFAGLEVLATIPVVPTERRLRRQRLVRLGSISALGSVLVIVFVLRLMMRGL